MGNKDVEHCNKLQEKILSMDRIIDQMKGEAATVVLLKKDLENERIRRTSIEEDLRKITNDNLSLSHTAKSMCISVNQLQTDIMTRDSLIQAIELQRDIAHDRLEKVSQKLILLKVI